MIRLLQLQTDKTFILVSFSGKDDIPRYAILSHTWGKDEVSYKDMTDGTGRSKTAYEKLEFCANRLKADDLQYCWVDTCCIDKSDAIEIQRSINSMFKWYREANKCYVYLTDVSTKRKIDDQRAESWRAAFRNSRWFTRGWTLQELLAPQNVEFFSRNSVLLGTKITLLEEIHVITGIALEALRGAPLQGFSAEERLRWGEKRQTTEEEDGAYSLLGIVNVSMSMRYGEGRQVAMSRLRRKIKKQRYRELQSPDPKDPNHVELAAKPSSTVPFVRDPDFIERGDLLDQIKNRCAVPGSRTAVVGLGGIGKSQLTIEHAYRTRETFPDKWIFWVHASNADRFQQGFKEIADLAQLPSRADPQADIFRMVRDWLRSEKSGTWLLILDNVDDADFLVRKDASTFEASAGCALIDYVPTSPHGAVLITSRTKFAASKIVADRDMIMISPMTEHDAVSLIEKKLGQAEDATLVQELAELLEYMPLALAQATAYISRLAPRYSLKRYIQDFRKSEASKTSLLNRETTEPRRDGEAKNSIILAWQISFEHLRRIRPSAFDLLSVMSFFDRQGIPEFVLRASRFHISSEETESTHDLGPSLQEVDEFEDDIAMLRDYAFITCGISDDVFDMHALVQFATKTWLGTCGGLEEARAQFMEGLYLECPFGRYEGWEKWQILFPHTKAAMAQEPSDRLQVEHWGIVMQRAAYYALEKAASSDAEMISDRLVKVMAMVCGADDPLLIKSISIRSSLLRRQGQWEQAQVLQMQVLESRKRTLGDEHRSTLDSMHTLAVIYNKQGRWSEAENLLYRVVEISRQVLGEDHPDTLVSLAELGKTYCKQSRWKEAEVLLEQAVERSKRIRGLEHPETVTATAHLVLAYQGQGKLKMAEELQVQVVDLNQRNLGHKHPFVLVSMGALASIYYDQGRLLQAYELDARVLEAQKRVLGEIHLETLESMHCLAYTSEALGRVQEALELIGSCVIGEELLRDANHPRVKKLMLKEARLRSTWTGRLTQRRLDGPNDIGLPGGPSP